MKLFRIALNNNIVTELLNEKGDLPFDDVFGENLRVAIPLINNKMSEIINKLQNGETGSGKKYNINISNGVAHTYRPDGSLDPREFRLGRVIKKEL